MGRRIIVTQYQASTGSGEVDGYSDRVIKYIPGDVIAGWVAANGIIKGMENNTNILWIAFIFGLFMSGFWTWRQISKPSEMPANSDKESAKTNKPPVILQSVVSAIAFAVWVFALGGPFETLSFYNPLLGSLFLIAFTLVSGIIVPKE